MPVLLLIVFILALIKKIKPYDNFIDGTKSAIPIAFNLFPYLTAIFILTELFIPQYQEYCYQQLFLKFLRLYQFLIQPFLEICYC